MRPSEFRLRLSCSSTQPTPARCGGSTCLGVVGRTQVPKCPNPQGIGREHLQGSGRNPSSWDTERPSEVPDLGELSLKLPTPILKGNFLS